MTALQDAPAAPEAAGAACPTPHDALAPYRAWVDSLEGEDPVDPDPIEVMAHGGHCQPLTRYPIHELSADLECAHGRVPIEGCEHGCHEPKPFVRPAPAKPPSPDLMQTLHDAKEQMMDAPNPDAPFGHKADGTPRKRPAPTAEQLAAATAGRAKARAAKANSAGAVLGAVLAPTPVTTEGPAQSPVLGRMVTELDAEIARLTAARDALAALA
jgi:hypothetical protein